VVFILSQLVLSRFGCWTSIVLRTLLGITVCMRKAGADMWDINRAVPLQKFLLTAHQHLDLATLFFQLLPHHGRREAIH
jgi:hypothetical protein